MKRSITILVICMIFASFLANDRALGSLRRPAAVDSLTRPQPMTYGPERPAGSLENTTDRGPSNLFSNVKAGILAKFRPIERGDQNIDFDSAEHLLNSKTSIEKIYDKDFEARMRGEYAARVAPYEAKINDPLHRPRAQDRALYDEGRRAMADWTAREVLSERLKSLLRGGDKDSAPMQVISAVRQVTGGESEEKADRKLTPEEKAARAHRLDLPKEAKAEEEEQIPTKLKTRLNLVKGHGQLFFQNPIVNTTLNGDRNDISLEMNRDFNKIGARSNLRYGVKQECLQVNVTKSITKQVSLDLDHQTFTGSKRGASGERSRETARINYSVSF